MDLSLYLARGWGLSLFLLASALLLNERRFLAHIKSFSDDYPLALIAGTFALILGAAQVAGYNMWRLDYRGLLTLLGWMTLLKGAAITFAPTAYLEQASRLITRKHAYNVALGVTLVMGIYLLFVGFSG